MSRKANTKCSPFIMSETNVGRRWHGRDAKGQEQHLRAENS